MDLIISGKVTVQNIDENGNILIIDTFTGGDVIGVNLVFSRKSAYPMTVLATQPTELISIDRALILKLCRKSEAFMLALLTSISDKSAILSDKINTISRKTIRECILDFLRFEQALQKSDIIKLNMTKKEMAERLGIPRSSLGRELIKLRNDGIIEYDAKTITLINFNNS